MASFLEELRRARAAIDRGENGLEAKVYATALEYITQNQSVLTPETAALVAATALGVERTTIEEIEPAGDSPRLLTKFYPISEMPVSAVNELHAQLASMLRRLSLSPPSTGQEWRVFEALLEFTKRMAAAERVRLEHTPLPDLEWDDPADDPVDDSEWDGTILENSGRTDQITALVDRHFGSPEEIAEEGRSSSCRDAVLVMLRDLGRLYR